MHEAEQHLSHLGETGLVVLARFEILGQNMCHKKYISSDITQCSAEFKPYTYVEKLIGEVVRWA